MSTFCLIWISLTCQDIPVLSAFIGGLGPGLFMAEQMLGKERAELGDPVCAPRKINRLSRGPLDSLDMREQIESERNWPPPLR